MMTRTILGICLTVGLGAVGADTILADSSPPEDNSMTQRATKKAEGSFEVDLQPASKDELPGGNRLSKLTLEKTYHGGLEATATGEMLTGTTAVDGSAAYVAIEHVEGTLGGRTGTFLLQHRGTMDRGGESLSVRVVPDSGTGELQGLTGSLEIEIEEGEHFYELEYSIPDRP